MAASLVFWILFLAYQANLDFLPASDAAGSTYLPVSLLADGDLTFTPEEDPFLFDWYLDTEHGPRPVEVHDLDQRIDGTPARDLYAAGRLRLADIPYYLTPTTREGVYANTFSLGAGLTALPVFIVARLVWGRAMYARPDVIWYAGKVAASLAVALSGLFVFLAAATFVPIGRAALIAILYGLGTCAWSIASQSLWQHGPNMLFLAAGTWMFLEAPRRRWAAAGAGLAYGLAVACRPTSLIVVMVTGLYLCLSHRDRCLPFALAAGVAGAGLAYYNQVMFGSPFVFGQTEVSVAMAESLTGSPNLWGTPPWKGAAGLLMSPSRGLLVYSPVAAVALPGLVAAWRNNTYRVLRPIAVSLLLTWVVAFTWYDWWGGWSFGYRPLVDSMVLLSLLATPALPNVLSSRWLRVPIALLAAWSIFVQVLGAFAYNGFGWNNRTQFEIALPGRTDTVVTRDHDEAVTLVDGEGGRIVGVEKLDVCRRAHLDRLWSWSDSQLLYYLKYPLLSRADKQDFIVSWLARYAPFPEERKPLTPPGTPPTL